MPQSPRRADHLGRRAGRGRPHQRPRGRPPAGAGRQRRPGADDPQDAAPEDQGRAHHRARPPAHHLDDASAHRAPVAGLASSPSMGLVLASVTDGLVDFAVRVINDLGLPGIFVLMLFESALIPIPSEATFLFAGFNVANGEYSMLAVVVVGVAANTVGSCLAYALGYFGRVDIIEKHGRKLHIKPSHLQWA